MGFNTTNDTTNLSIEQKIVKHLAELGYITRARNSY